MQRTRREGLGDSQALVTRTDYGDDWPFTFEHGLFVGESIDGEPVARIVGSDGVEYALNGPAIARGYVELTEQSEVWRDEDRALAICHETP